MANRYLRGTFTRNAWDFYEVGAAWVFGSYNAGPGAVGFILRNNGIAQSYLDIFRAEVSTSIPSSISWSIAAPSAAHNSIEPTSYFNVPVQLDLGAPPGDMSVYTSPAGSFTPILKTRADSISYDAVELANGGAFLTLPPLYGLAVNFNLSGAGVITLTAWYQSITDHTPPAT